MPRAVRNDASDQNGAPLMRPRSGTDPPDRLLEEADGLVRRVDLGRLAADRVIATGRIGECDLDPRDRDRAADHGLELVTGGIEVLAGTQLADQAELAAAGNGDETAALDGGDEQERAADESVGSARFEIGGMGPERRENRVGCLQRVDALLRHAEIGGAAGDLDVGDEEAHLGRIDVEGRRFDIDRQIGTRPGAGVELPHQRLHAGADARTGLAALLVADEGKHDVAGETCVSSAHACATLRRPWRYPP